MTERYYRNYIDGTWVEAKSGKRRTIINPANGKAIATVADGSVADAKAAIAAAKKAFYETREWRDSSGPAKGDVLYRIAMRMEERAAELAMLETLNAGKPLRESEGDVEDAIACFKFYAGMTNKPYGGIQNVGDGFGKMHSMTVHEPVGVCASIAPWNYPIVMCAWKLAPALAAGNCVIFKPASLTPITAIKMFEIFEEAGLPKGTANLVVGAGGTVGQELAESHDVDMITFTGSTPVGQRLMQLASGNMKKIGLELGGKSPNVVFADAEFEGAVEWAMMGCFFNAGQVCNAGTRLIVEESIKDEFVARLAERARNLKLGDPMNNPDVGALISKYHMNKVLNYMRTGMKEGARLVCGGYRYVEGECADGYFVAPTIFDNCTPEMTIVQEEIFGPVLTVQTFKTEEEAIALANDTIYGLAGAVFTTDGARALRVIKEIRAGITWINCYNPTFMECPWGGYKMSGLGRDLGIQGLQEYQETKQININLYPGSPGWFSGGN